MMRGISGFRLRHEVARTDRIIASEVTDAEALARVIGKLRAIGVDKFDAMSEEEYGDWLNTLPQDEFIALIQLTDEQANTEQSE